MLNVGILGCGPISQFAHLEACQKARNVRLYSVCDTARELAEKMAHFYGADKVYTNYDEMLEDKDLDAVIIATSDAFHIPAAIKAIESDKHVLVEKPLGADLQEALTLEKLVSKSGLTFQVGHMKRFDAGIVSAKNFIDNEMGGMVAFKAWYCDSTHRYDQTDSTQPVPVLGKNTTKPTRNPKENLRRYFMMAHGSHLLDTARFLAGRINSVQAHLVEKNGMYNWFVDTGFENGANGHLDLTVAVRMDWHEGFHIYGEQGSVLAKTYNPWYFKVSEVQCFSEKDGQYRQVLDNKAHFFALQLESFAECILNGAPQKGTNIKEGIESIKGMLAIDRSVKTGKRISLDEVTGAL